MSTSKLATSKRTFTSCQQSASNVSEASSCAAAPSKRKKRRGEQHKAGKSQVIPVIISQQEKERSLKLNSSKAIKTLVTEKTYYFETSNRNQVIPYIREFFTSESQTVFTWPCAVLLASYIVTSNVTKNLRTIEIGAGCGLPSIVAAMCGASACVITERADEPLIMQNLEMNVSKNNLSDICSVKPLNWKEPDIALLSKMDAILGADVFYSTEDFESVIALVDLMITTNPGAAFYTTYQERSTRRSIAPYLEKYDMYAETIPLESFLHVSHRTDGSTYIEEFDSIVRKERTTSKQDVSNSFVGQYPQENKMEDDQKKLRLTALSTFDSMLLLKITRKRQ